MRVTTADVAVFAAESAVYVAVGVAGWRAGSGTWTRPLLAASAVAVMALWWGMLHALKAPVDLPPGADAVLRALWFAVGVAALLA